MLALAVVLSVAGIALGPALVALGRGRAVLSSAIDGLTLGLLPSLVLLRLLPHLYEEMGVTALALALAGYLALHAVEHRSHKAAHNVGRAVAVPALAVHSLLDGAALALSAASASGSTRTMLGLAVVLHRLPDGLLLAAALTPEAKPKQIAIAVAIVGFATIAGALGGQGLLAIAPEALLHGLVALGLGVMLRLAVHRHGPVADSKSARAASGVAFVIALALAVAIPSPDNVLERSQGSELSFAGAFVPLFVEAAPAWILGLIAALGARAVASSITPSRAFALMSLVTCAIASVRFLGLPVAAIATLGAIATWALSMRSRERAEAQDEPTSFVAWIGRAAPSFLFTLVAASILEAALGPSPFAPTRALGPLIAVAIAIALGARPEGGVVLAAMLVHKGLSAGAAAALLAIAPACSPAGAQPFTVRARALALPAIVALAVGFAASAIVADRTVPELHLVAAHHHHPIEIAAAIALGAGIVVSFLRAGARPWFAPLVGQAAREHAHHHAHDHHHLKA